MLLSISVRGDEEPEMVRVKVAGEARHALMEYVLLLDKLKAMEAAKKEPVYMDVGWEDGGEKCVSWRPQLTDEEMAALLHRARPLILQNEEVGYFQARRVLGGMSDSRLLRRFMKLQHAKHSAVEWQREIRFNSGGELVNTDDVFINWVNAVEYHQDRARRAELSRISTKALPGLVEYVCVKILFDKIRAADNVGNLCRVLLAQLDSIDVEGFTVRAGA